jgi:hypothetical protein
VLLLLFAFAGPARADGEDDPAFGSVGTTFTALGDFFPLIEPPDYGFMRPRSDQAPDGAIITATGLRDERSGRCCGGVGQDGRLRVVRMDAAGKQSGFDGDGTVDVDYGPLYRLLDVEVLSNGNIILVTEGESTDEQRGGDRVIQIRTLAPDGSEPEEGYEFFAPEGCPYGSAVAADTDTSGRVFAAWECKGPSYLARYDGENDATRSLPEETEDADILEVELGPNGLVYLLGGGYDYSFEPFRRLRSGFPYSVVARFGAEDLEWDQGYGEDGAAFAPGFPIDFTVSSTSHVTVWSDPEFRQDDVRGTAPETWDFFGFDPDGDPNESFGDEGWAEIEHPELGPIESVFCARLKACSLGRPQVIAQGDDKVIAIGHGPIDFDWDRGEPPVVPGFFKDRTIIRLTTTGALDPSWSDDGVRKFSLDQPDGGALYLTIGPPTLQSDGKLVIPHLTLAGDLVTRVPQPPTGFSLGVSRIGLTPAAAPPPPAAATAVPVTAASRTCISRRVFRIRLRTGRRRAERSAIKTATVTVNGRNVPINSGARRTSQVDLRNLPKGRFTVVIRLTLADGGKVRDTRRYRTCTPKQARELPGLRTRKPKSKRRG